MAAVQRVVTVSQARELAEHLLGTDRRLPSVVITAGAGDDGGYISAEHVAEEVGDLAEVWWMPTGDPTWEFKAAMPPMTQVFGEAARVYALDPRWQTDPYASRLYMCGTRARAETIQDDLVADAMEAAGSAGLLQRKVAEARVVSGTVTGLTANRALVRGDFGFGTIRPELLPGAVPVDRLLAKDMVVAGRYDERDKLIDISDLFRPATDALADYSVGDDVLVRVRTVGSSVVAVELYPGTIVELRVAQVTGNDLDDLRDLMSVGEVVAARIERVGSWMLSMAEIDDEASATACSLLPGGPPWLEARHELEAEPAQPPETAEPGAASAGETMATPAVSAAPTRRAPMPGPHAGEMVRLQENSEALRRQVSALTAELAQVDRLREHAHTQLRRAETTIEQLRTKNRRQQKKSGAESGGGSRLGEQFQSPEERLRHEVYLAWVEKIPAGEKSDRPLPGAWVVGPDFTDSLRRMKPEVQRKVPGVIVEILVGLADRSDARGMHPLRTSLGGDAQAHRRHDGAVCWRTAVQRNSPSAARLHFWRLADHSVELSRVVVHDDMKP